MLIASRLSLCLAIGGTCGFYLVAARNPTPVLLWAYPYYLLPVAFALIPWRWRMRWARVIAAALLILFVSFGFSAGIFFVPAALLMIVAAFLPIRSAAG
jgi:hypothetical protein